MTVSFSWSDIKSFFKMPQFCKSRKPYDPMKRAIELEEKTLALSGLRPHKDIEIFDVPIRYKGSHLMHTIICGHKNKETLVLIHGYMGALALFYPILQDLSKRFRVICVDLLGLGLSSRPDFSCDNTKDTINYFLDSLDQWRKALNLKKFHMGGHSFGGYLAGKYALKFPNQVQSLYLLSPTGFTEKQEEQAPIEWAAKMTWAKRQFWQIYFQSYSRFIYKARLTAQEFVRKHPWMGKLSIRAYIQMLYGSNFEHAEVVSDFIFESFMIPGGSEKSVHYVLRPPRIGAEIPLEGFVTKSLKLPIYAYFGVEDWVDWTGAYKVAQDPKHRHFKFTFIVNSGHQMIMQQPSQLAALMLETPQLKRFKRR
jgi:pimeloyl-ACP methyl ester carboxylesterase